MNPAVAVQILSFGGDDVFQLDVALHNDATAGQKYLDMHAFDVELSLRTGRVKVVFLNKFVQNLLVRTLHKYQSISMNTTVLSVLSHCWLGVRKSIQHVNKLSDVVLVWLSV